MYHFIVSFYLLDFMDFMDFQLILYETVNYYKCFVKICEHWMHELSEYFK